MKTEYPLLSELVILALLPFASTYLCEKPFSTLTYLKTKYRSNLKDLEPALRPAITDLITDIANFIVFYFIFSVL